MRTVIIGAGLAGCSVGWHLRGEDVLVLEQAEQPGAEASSQNAGMIRRLGEDPYERALAIRTAAFLADPGDDWDGLTPSTVTGALLSLAHDPDHLSDAVAHLRASGVVVERCENPAQLAPALAGSALIRSWYVPDERLADAWQILTGLLRGIRRRGGEVRCGVYVQRIVVEGGRVVGVETSAGRIGADRVVLAAGAWSGRLAADLGLIRPLIPLRRTLLHIPTHPLSRPDHPWCWIDDVGIYIRPEGRGWLTSGCDEAVDPPQPGPGSRGPVEAMPRALAMDKLARHFPALGPVRLSTGWTGLRTFAPDRRPVLGSDGEVAGLWWAAGLGGFGVTCGIAAGEAVAGWMQGQRIDWLDAEGVSPNRRYLSRWPIRPVGSLSRPRLISGTDQRLFAPGVGSSR
ncbi:MAG: glycine/D-amino acid oxidase-like deaminating enzyme [Myxococcota bacterium]|jgi:glycine/D-amino acid oxidase-like deaminating enzyme